MRALKSRSTDIVTFRSRRPRQKESLFGSSNQIRRLLEKEKKREKKNFKEDEKVASSFNDDHCGVGRDPFLRDKSKTKTKNLEGAQLPSLWTMDSYGRHCFQEINR